MASSSWRYLGFTGLTYLAADDLAERVQCCSLKGQHGCKRGEVGEDDSSVEASRAQHGCKRGDMR